MFKKNDFIKTSTLSLDKRHTLKLIAIAPFLLVSINSHAGFWNFLGTHAVRFVGGLVFDTVASVLVNIIQGGYHNSLPKRESNFNHSAYKIAVSRLGLSDVEYDKSRIVRLNLIGDANVSRFEVLHRYLYDNKIRIIPAQGNYSRSITLKTTPDDLFTIEGFVFDTNETSQIRQHHYTEMLSLTDNKTFKRWIG